MYIFKLRPKLFPYEKQFAWAEVKKIARKYNATVEDLKNNRYALLTDKSIDISLLEDVTYFKEIILPNNKKIVPNITT